ncbi:unnamed protein product [Arctogadus glacialis]
MMRTSQMMRTSEKNAIQPILLGNKLTATKVVAPLGCWISNDLPGLLFKPAVGPPWADPQWYTVPPCYSGTVYHCSTAGDGPMSVPLPPVNLGLCPPYTIRLDNKLDWTVFSMLHNIYTFTVFPKSPHVGLGITVPSMLAVDRLTFTLPVGLFRR